MIPKDKALNKKNGRRQRNSPTSYADSSDDDDLRENKINVGRNHQASIPRLMPAKSRASEAMNESDRGTLLYSYEDCKMSENEIGVFVRDAMEAHGYNAEQALGMLFWHKFDEDKAFRDMRNFFPITQEGDRWTEGEMKVFEKYHLRIMQDDKENDFNKLQKLLPHKPMGSILTYYYTKYFRYPKQERRSSSENDENSARKMNA